MKNPGKAQDIHACRTQQGHRSSADQGMIEGRIKLANPDVHTTGSQASGEPNMAGHDQDTDFVSLADVSDAESDGKAYLTPEDQGGLQTMSSAIRSASLLPLCNKEVSPVPATRYKDPAPQLHPEPPRDKPKQWSRSLADVRRTHALSKAAK